LREAGYVVRIEGNWSSFKILTGKLTGEKDLYEGPDLYNVRNWINSAENKRHTCKRQHKAVKPIFIFS
jgi:hypothetical protein